MAAIFYSEPKSAVPTSKQHLRDERTRAKSEEIVCVYTDKKTEGLG